MRSTKEHYDASLPFGARRLAAGVVNMPGELI
jgi:hypothetical protein